MAKVAKAPREKYPEDGMVRMCFDQDDDRYYLVGVKHTLVPGRVAKAVMGFLRNEHATLTPFQAIIATVGLLRSYQSVTLLSLTTTKYNCQLHVSIYFTRGEKDMESCGALTNSDSGSITLGFEQTWQPLEADDPFCYIGAKSVRAPKYIAREAAGIGAGRWVNPAEQANNIRRSLRTSHRVRVTGVKEFVNDGCLYISIEFDWLRAAKQSPPKKSRRARRTH